MVPYIALLIVLLAVILFSVYRGVDGFTTSFTDATTFQQFMEALRTALQKNKELKRVVDSSTQFDDTLALPKLRELGFDRAPGEKPFSKALSVQMETDGILISGMINMFERALESGTLKSTDLLKTARANVQVDSVAKALHRIESVLEKRSVYIASKTVPSVTTTTRDASGNAVTGTTDASGTPIVNINDLFSAVTGSEQAIQSSNVTAPPRSSINSLFGTAPSQTMASTKEMEDRIAKSVATQLKDSLLVKRATENVVDDMGCPYAPYSNAAAQGQEYRHVKPAPSSAPDMSEYIRKDSIPCWNCSL